MDYSRHICLSDFIQRNTSDPNHLDLKLILRPNKWGSIETHYWGWAIAGLFALSASAISMTLMFRHFRNYTKPQYQRHIVRILFMVPVYCLLSWLTYRFFDYALAFELVRSCYEAFVIYEFFALLLRYLGENEAEQRRRLASKPIRKLPPPACFVVNPAKPHFLMDCKLGAMQYVVIRPTTVVIASILQTFHVFCQESLSPQFGHVWYLALNCISTFFAMFALATLYLTVRSEISEYHPIAKFLSVKFVIFMTFWQSIIIGILRHSGLIKETQYWTEENIATGLQSLLICVEMLIAAYWHTRPTCFGYEEFVIEDKNTNVLTSIKDAFNPAQTFRDLALGGRHICTRCFRKGRDKAAPSSFTNGKNEIVSTHKTFVEKATHDDIEQTVALTTNRYEPMVTR